MIKVENLHRHFGGFRAVDGASLEIREGSITGLVGPNGAGKTTLFNVIAGVLPPTSGRVTMAGDDITGMSPHELFHKGLLRTFQRGPAAAQWAEAGGAPAPRLNDRSRPRPQGGSG